MKKVFLTAAFALAVGLFSANAQTQPTQSGKTQDDKTVKPKHDTESHSKSKMKSSGAGTGTNTGVGSGSSADSTQTSPATTPTDSTKSEGRKEN